MSRRRIKPPASIIAIRVSTFEANFSYLESVFKTECITARLIMDKCFITSARLHGLDPSIYWVDTRDRTNSGMGPGAFHHYDSIYELRRMINVYKTFEE